MQKQTQLLGAIALSVGLISLGTVGNGGHAVTDAWPRALPSLAPVLEKVLPTVVSVQVEGTSVQGQ